MKKLVFATNNGHKVEEVRAILEEIDPKLNKEIEILSLADIGCDVDIPETGLTFAENAMQKAEYVKVHYNLDCFADDSGLEVRALGMDPGVCTARYADTARIKHNSDANMDKLLRNLRNVEDRHAQFRTVIVLLMDGKKEEFEGICKGEITKERSGKEGFGYDPIFKPEGYDITFAEMPMEEKNRISHRGQAVRKLADFLREEVCSPHTVK